MNHVPMLRGREARFDFRAVVASALAAMLLLAMGANATYAGARSGTDALTPPRLTAQPGASTAAQAPGRRPAGPELDISGPSSVQAGEPIVYELTALRVKDLGGFEVVLEYDRSALEFAGTQHLGAGFAASGRGVIPLGPVATPAGVAIGMYSCPINGCKPFGHPTHTSGPSGTVALGSIRLLPTASGTISVHLTNVRFVDARGRSISLALRSPHLAVRVGKKSLTIDVHRHVAWALGRGGVPANARADVNSDGRVTYPDVSDVGIAWDEARLNGNPCATAHAADVNRDGCVDVTDVQIAASQMTASPRGLASTRAGTTSASMASAPASTFTVTSTGDQADSSPGDGICSTSSGCTLRAAITEANLHAGTDAISFAIPGTGVKRIQIASTLPTINDVIGGTTIDGYTQSGAAPNSDPLLDNAAIRIELYATSYLDVLIMSSAGNTVRGLAILNGRQHVGMTGPSAHDNTLAGCFIGTDAGGTFAAPYISSAAQGVYIDKGAAFNQLGVPDLAGRNIVSGNGNNGIRTWHDMTDYNRFQNNLVGVGPTGTILRNGGHGIDINAGSSYNLVGGTGALERNVFSGNHGEGVEVSHGTLTVDNQVISNFIGTDVTGNGGSLSTGNGSHGVHIEDGPVDSVVSGNVIGYNGYRTDSNGGGIGVEGFYTAGNHITNNRVGISLNGTPIPNDEGGIRVFYHASWTFIGPGNISAYNPNGVEINGALDFDNVITRNSLFANTNLGIAFGATGANNNQAAPTLIAASTSAVAGTSCAGCTVEIFVGQSNPSDAGGGNFGQGKSFVGWGVAAADGTFSIPVTGVQGTDLVTATATDAVQNTSKFSHNLAVGTGTPPPPITPPPPPPPTGVVASDSFSRTTTDTWGSAPIGGGYAYVYCTAYDLDTNGSTGTMSLPNPQVTATCPNQPATGVATNRGAWLMDTSARDVDMTVKVHPDKAAAGDSENVALSARHWRGQTEYRPQFRFSTNGQVWMQAYKLVTGRVTSMGINTQAPGVQSGANRDVLLRVQVTGVNPTTIRMKAWNPGQTEPSGWAYVVTDSDPQLQRAGSVGIEGWLAYNSTNYPVLYTVDDYLVTTTDTPLPAADFTSTQTNGTLTEQFTDTSTNSPTAWSWDFGDGSSSTQQNPSHTYSAPGAYSVALTATNIGGSGSATKTVTVNVAVYAADTFTRARTDTWGSADTGSLYAYVGAQADFDVNGGAGTMAIGSAGASRAAILAGVSARDVDVTLKFKLDKLPNGGSGVSFYAVARQTASTTEYRVKVRVTSTGQAYLSASTMVSGSEATIGSEVALSPLVAPGVLWSVHAQITGISPTTIRARAWPTSDVESSTWRYSQTDTTTGLQQAGAVGLRGYASSGSTNVPFLLTFDDYRVTAP